MTPGVAVDLEGRVASTADVANAVLYLVSPLGSYANGIAIPLNGGSYLH